LLKFNGYSHTQKSELQTQAHIRGMYISGKVVAVDVVIREKKDGRHYWHHFELCDKA
jgi:hypothetical protein